MAILEVLKYPNSVLRKKCEPVKEVDDAVRKIAQDMADTMYAANGIGLAAPQAGVLKQIIVIDIGDGLITLINPEIELLGDKSKMEEGCLCLPKLLVEVERNEKVRVRGLNLEGATVLFDTEELLARVFQHETDHLTGTLIIDRLSKIKRDLAVKEYRKLSMET
jgi:peptide deformylase